MRSPMRRIDFLKFSHLYLLSDEMERGPLIIGGSKGAHGEGAHKKCSLLLFLLPPDIAKISEMDSKLESVDDK